MHDPGDVGRLIACALDPKLTPGRDQTYKDLVTRFKEDGQFAQDAAATVRGQGMVILQCDLIHGLVLAAQDGSPYAYRLEDYGTISNTDERLLHGLIQLAIAATVFPTAKDLEEEGPLRSVTAQEIYDHMDQLAQKLKERAGDRTDPPADCPQLEPVWRLFLRTRATDTTSDARTNPHTTMGMIKRAFRFLVEQGFADELPQAGLKDTYRMRARYRLHVLDASGYIMESQAYVSDFLQSAKTGV
jgi:hypothetical protein